MITDIMSLSLQIVSHSPCDFAAAIASSAASSPSGLNENGIGN